MPVDVIVGSMQETQERAAMWFGDQEQTLIEKARNGDRAAFDKLAQRHRATVVKICTRFFQPNREHIEEAVSETFVRAFKYLGGFRGDCHYSTWLYRIADRACIDIANKVARQPILVEIDPERDIGESVPSAEEEVIRQEIAHPWLDALKAGLDERDWLIVILTYQYEMTSEQVADQLGMTAVNVRKRLNQVIRPVIQQVSEQIQNAQQLQRADSIKKGAPHRSKI